MVDPKVALGAVVREVRRIEKNGKPAHVVVASRAYDASAEEVWDALTKPERIARWFAPVSGELKLGGRYRIEGNAGGTIETCEPAKTISLTWEFAGGVSWLTVSLSSSGKRTRVVLEHTVPEDDHFKKFGPGAVGLGWDATLYGLELHLADPSKSTREEGMKWMGSEDGKSFFRASGEDWLRAYLASGADEAHARAVTAQTIAFFTGAGADHH